MLKRSLFVAKTLAIAALGVAVAGCESEMMLGAGQGQSKNAEVEARLASQSEEKPALNVGEAGPTDVIAISQPSTETNRWLTVKTDAFDKNEAIPPKLAAGGSAAGPKLEWSGAPDSTESFAVVVEDPDSVSSRPFVHLIAFNIPANQASLKLDDLNASRMADNGATLGKNSRSEMNYLAPEPSVGQTHHYHYQIFALDGKLPLPPGANKKELLDAMSGHVIAKGEIVGTYEAK